MPLVSIIICTKNRAGHLRLTLESIALLQIQGDLSAELLVIDNASTDQTAEVVKTSRLSNVDVRYVLEPRPGQCHARNRGLGEARGDIIVFTDDDVRVPPDWVEKLCRPIFSGQAHAVVGGIKLAPHLERAWMTPIHRQWLASTEGLDPTSPRNLIGANMAFSREVLKKVPAFDPELGPGALGFGDDTLFADQLMEAGFSISAAPEATIEHHFEQSRLTRKQFLESAKRRGRTKAYLAYHWYQLRLDSPYYMCFLLGLKLVYWRIRRWRQIREADGCASWEMLLLKQLNYYRHFINESRFPRKYERRGLIKCPGGAQERGQVS